MSKILSSIIIGIILLSSSMMSVSAAPVIGSVNNPRPILLDENGKALVCFNEPWEVSTNQKIVIQSTLTNALNEPQPFAYLLQIWDEDSKIVSLSWNTGKLEREQRTIVSESWTPDKEGRYTVETSVWDSVEKHAQLSRIQFVDLVVSPAKLGVQSETSRETGPAYAREASIWTPLGGEILVKEEPVKIRANYVFMERPICNFVIISLIKDDKGFPYQINHTFLNETISYYSPYSHESRYHIGGEVINMIKQAGNFTVEAYAWTDLENPIPLAPVARADLQILERTNQVRKGDVLLAIVVPNAQNGGPTTINITLSVTNLGSRNLTLKSDKELPLKIELYFYNIENYTELELDDKSCELYDEQSKQKIANSSVILLKTHDRLNYTCGFHTFGGKMGPNHYVAIGSLVGMLEPWDEAKYGERRTSGTIASTKPIHFTAYCTICG